MRHPVRRPLTGEEWLVTSTTEYAPCNRTFQNVAEFDRHRRYARCREPDTSLITASTDAEGSTGWHAVNSRCVHSERASRNHLEDIGLTDDDNRTGPGDPARHVEHVE
jgi:hypothetical protein